MFHRKWSSKHEVSRRSKSLRRSKINFSFEWIWQEFLKWMMRLNMRIVIEFLMFWSDFDCRLQNLHVLFVLVRMRDFCEIKAAIVNTLIWQWTRWFVNDLNIDQWTRSLINTCSLTNERRWLINARHWSINEHISTSTSNHKSSVR